MRWKWSNVPIPEAHLAGLSVGIVLHIFLSKRLFQISWIGHLSGWPVLMIGIGICGWSVIVAKEMNIASPNHLLKSGPYALSRNPMYVGWSLIYLGIAFVANSTWILVFLPFVLLYIHFVDIRREERFLETQFGEEYRQYQKKVHRYL